MTLSKDPPEDKARKVAAAALLIGLIGWARAKVKTASWLVRGGGAVTTLEPLSMHPGSWHSAPTKAVSGFIGGGIITSTNSFRPLHQGLGFTSGENIVWDVISMGGVIDDFYVKLSNNVGGTGALNFTVHLNGAPTAQVITIPVGSSSGSDSAHPITVYPGDYVHIQQTKTL
ncbi:unnamed protein product, partial [marine sediment metagenome]